MSGTLLLAYALAGIVAASWALSPNRERHAWMIDLAVVVALWTTLGVAVYVAIEAVSR